LIRESLNREPPTYLLGRVEYVNNERAARVIMDAELREKGAKP
jgi:hypothetical protein